MKKLFFIFTIPLLATSIAQNIDSLKTELKNAIHDTARVRLCVEISEKCAYEDLTTIFDYAKQAVELAEKRLTESPSNSIKKAYLRALPLALNNVAYVKQQKGEIIEALDYYNRAITLEEANEDKQLLPTLFSNMGNLYQEHGDIGHALQEYHRALKLLQKRGDKGPIAASLSNLGYLYESTNDLTKAEDYYLQAINIYTQLGANADLALLQNGVGRIYYAKGDMPKAIEFFKKSLLTAKKNSDKISMANAYNKLADVYQDQRNFDEAIASYEEALKLLEALNDKRGQATVLRNYAGLYVMKNDFQKAEEYAKRGLTIAKESGSYTNIRDEADMLCKIYIAQNSKKSTSVCALFAVMNDSVKNIETRKNAVLVKFKQDYEKHEMLMKETAVKEETNKAESPKSNIGLILTSIAIIALGLLLFFFMRKK